MSAQGSNFCDTKLLYDLTFKIVSIEFSDEDNKTDQSDMCVVARFAEKCVQIVPYKGEDVDESEQAGKEQSTRDVSRKSSKGPSTKPSRDSSKKPSQAPSDASSKSIRQSSKPRASEKAEAAPSNEADEEVTDVGSRPSRKSTKDSEPSKSARQTTQRKPASDIFGSSTERFEGTPFCLCEKLTKHCIKYEIVTRDGQLIGVLRAF
jgi:hypothetical protein